MSLQQIPCLFIVTKADFQTIRDIGMRAKVLITMAHDGQMEDVTTDEEVEERVKEISMLASEAIAEIVHAPIGSDVFGGLMGFGPDGGELTYVVFHVSRTATVSRQHHLQIPISLLPHFDSVFQSAKPLISA